MTEFYHKFVQQICYISAHVVCTFILIVQSQAAARMMAVQYAGVGLPSYHVESRFLLLQATGDHR